jgi:cell division septation protein DedD
MPLFRGMFLTATLTAPLPLSPPGATPSHSDSSTTSTTATTSKSKKSKKSTPKATSQNTAATAPANGSAPAATTTAAPAVASFGFQQTFLPKFENERQDESIAEEIVAAADQRYMVATVKHSGSLNTLSHALMGAKNSIDNEFTGVAILLLHAHYARLFP